MDQNVHDRLHKNESLECEERENQQDATIRCLLSTSVSTSFGHHYAHFQENKDRVLLHMVYCAFFSTKLRHGSGGSVVVICGPANVMRKKNTTVAVTHVCNFV